MIRSVMFDFGGVITDSPFDAFQRYEEAQGLPVGTIRSINSTNPDTMRGPGSNGAKSTCPSSATSSKARRTPPGTEWTRAS